MKKSLVTVALAILCSMVVACRHAGLPSISGRSPEGSETGSDRGIQQPRDASAAPAQAALPLAQRLQQSRVALAEGRFDTAEAILAPTLSEPNPPAEVTQLASRIAQARAAFSLKAARERLESRALAEVEEQFSLPRTYGRTVKITRDTELFEVPEGPMEELVNRRVSMRLENVGVPELVRALSEIDGLNIVADDALQAQSSLTLNVRDVPLHEVLSYIARNMGIAFHLGANTVWVTAADDTTTPGPKLETRIYPLRRGLIPTTPASGQQGGGAAPRGDGGEEDTELEEVLGLLFEQAPADAAYQIFPHRNLLVVRTTREELRLVEEVLREFDSRPAQVLIEARFVTIAQSDLFELGFDFPEFAMEGRDLDVEDPVMTLDGSSTFTDFTNAAVGGNVNISGILGSYTYRAVLHAFERAGTSRTLSVPRITVLNNREAVIRRGDVMYYYEDYDLETIDVGDLGTRTQLVPSGNPTELELGITLRVRVNVGRDEKTVMLGLAPEITQFIRWEYYNTDAEGNALEDAGATATVKLPITNENTLETVVLVESGETVVLGGMIESNVNEDVSQVPILGDIPIIGRLFQHRSTSNEPTHLLIFVTARVQNAAGEFVEVESGESGGETLGVVQD